MGLSHEDLERLCGVGSWWHGSPTKIAHVHVKPGVKIGRDRYGMGRNQAVFVTQSIKTAAQYGSGQVYYGSDPTVTERRTTYAEWLYEVKPEGLFEWHESPHSKILDERTCKRARILRAFRCANPDAEYNTETWTYAPYVYEEVPLTDLRRKASA